MENNENRELCAKCGGECCKSMGCTFSPNDFKEEITKNSMIKLLETGLVSIDCYDGDPTKDENDYSGDYINAYYPRIRNLPTKFSQAELVEYSWSGQCGLLKEDGCRLSFEYRPYQAKVLIPNENGCECAYSKQKCAIDWLPYHDIFEDIVCNFSIKADELNSLNLSKISEEDMNKRIEQLKLLLKRE